ncbi:MAG: hypothetical protein ACTSXL_04485 [Alphaproteobacteria bacterium]
MTFVSLIASSLGFSLIIKTGFSLTFGINSSFIGRKEDFSAISCEKEVGYSEKEGVNPDTGERIASLETREERIKSCKERREREEQRKNNQWKEDLLSGLTLFIVGGLFLLMHCFGLKKVRIEEESYLIKRLFLVYNIVFFGIASIVTLT